MFARPADALFARSATVGSPSLPDLFLSSNLCAFLFSFINFISKQARNLNNKRCNRGRKLSSPIGSFASALLPQNESFASASLILTAFSFFHSLLCSLSSPYRYPFPVLYTPLHSFNFKNKTKTSVLIALSSLVKYYYLHSAVCPILNLIDNANSADYG